LLRAIQLDMNFVVHRVHNGISFALPALNK
jgi:hypothetical protein